LTKLEREMVPFIFNLPTKVIFGCGTITHLGTEAEGLGQKTMLVTYPQALRRLGMLEHILKSVVQDLKVHGLDTVLYEKVEANPRTATVDEGARMAREEQVDLVIGLGGGSAMDVAKGIALASTGIGSIHRYLKRELEVASPILPIIQVPTTASSGSETNSAMVITDWETREKIALNTPQLFAKVAIIDPELTLTVPAKATAQGGVDIFCSTAELYITTKKPSPLTDGILETIMKIVVDYLPKVLARPDDIEARTQLCWVAALYSSQFARLGGGAGFWTCHGIEHAISGYYDIAHGDGLAALLPSWMKYTFPVTEERFRQLGSSVFGEEDGLEATLKWLERIGMKLRLRDLRVEHERAQELANYAIKTAPPSSPFDKHPKPLDAESIAQIIRDAY